MKRSGVRRSTTWGFLTPGGRFPVLISVRAHNLVRCLDHPLSAEVGGFEIGSFTMVVADTHSESPYRI